MLTSIQKNRRSITYKPPITSDMIGAKSSLQSRATREGKHHLVVLHRRYHRLICRGLKPLECRFSKVRMAPIGFVRRGDILRLKPPGGQISTWCEARRVWQFDSHLGEIVAWMRQYPAAILHADGQFRDRRESARFGGLIWLGPIHHCQPFQITKSNRRGWVARPGAPAVGLATHSTISGLSTHLAIQGL